MREVVLLHIGQAGIQVGNEYWKIICDEHDITTTGRLETGKKQANGNWDIFFNKSQTNRFYPSAILIDSDPTVIDGLKDTKDLFNPKFIFSGTSSVVTYPQGYSFGQKHESEIMDMINEAVNKTDSLQGFILMHSIGGGIGAGLGVWLLEKIKENFPNQSLMTFSVFPFQEISAAVTPYNSLFAIEKLIQLPDIVVVIDNSTILRTARNFYQDGSFETMNNLISQSCSSITASLRFKGMLNTDIKEFRINLVPFPKLKFLISALTPLMQRKDLDYEQITSAKLAEEIFDDDHMMVDTTLGDTDLGTDGGVFLASSVLFRGNIAEEQIRDVMAKIKDKVNFPDYISTGIKYGQTTTPRPSIEGHIEASGLHNHTSMKVIFKRLLDKFDLLYKREAFLHWYLQAGMNKTDFQQARDATAVLINEYINAEA